MQKITIMFVISLALAILVSRASADTLTPVDEAQERSSQISSSFEQARDFLNNLEGVEPQLFEVGKYKPALMTDDMDGIWLEYYARNDRFVGSVEHYFRLREFNQVVLSQTISGLCQLKLTSIELENGYYWDDNAGWARGAASLFFRSEDCTLLSRAGDAFESLIEMDGGRATFVSRLK